MKESTYADYCRRIHELVLYIHANLDKPLPIEELSARCYLSPYHFQRIFSKVAGESCRWFIRRLLLERAAWQLINTNDSISEIALSAGFQSQEPFARAFRSAYGSPATGFRAAKWLTHWHGTPNSTHYTHSGEPEFHPMSAPGQGIPFHIEWIEPFRVVAKRHHGAPQLIGKSWIEFVKELEQAGFDWKACPLISYAERLRRYMPTADVIAYTAVQTDEDLGPLYQLETLGGCHALVAKYEGPRYRGGDYWLRVWAEALPASGYVQEAAPCFQKTTYQSLVTQNSEFVSYIYIPVKPKKRISGQSKS